eukprot:1046151-Pelagomonas_calceolata.AAC.1
MLMVGVWGYSASRKVITVHPYQSISGSVVKHAKHTEGQLSACPKQEQTRKKSKVFAQTSPVG